MIKTETTYRVYFAAHLNASIDVEADNAEAAIAPVARRHGLSEVASRSS